jgi:uncharacterized protein YggE
MKFLVLLLLGGTVLATAGSAQPQTNPVALPPDHSARTIVVYGTATRHVAPNQANIVIAVVTQNKDALVAQQDNARRSAAVIEAVKGIGDAQMEVSTGEYLIEVQNRVEGNIRTTDITGYKVTNSVAVKLRDLSKVGGVIDRAAQAGANSVSSVSFGLDDDSAVRREVLTAATADALARAQAVARGLNGVGAPLHLKPVDVREAGLEFNPLPMAADRAMTFARAAAAPPTNIESGKLDVSATVYLRAELE